MTTIDRSETPGSEVIERSKYRETRRSGKATSEARDRGTKKFYRVFACLQLKGAMLPRAANLVRETTEKR